MNFLVDYNVISLVLFFQNSGAQQKMKRKYSSNIVESLLHIIFKFSKCFYYPSL